MPPAPVDTQIQLRGCSSQIRALGDPCRPNFGQHPSDFGPVYQTPSRGSQQSWPSRCTRGRHSVSWCGPMTISLGRWNRVAWYGVGRQDCTTTTIQYSKTALALHTHSCKPLLSHPFLVVRSFAFVCVCVCPVAIRCSCRPLISEMSFL